ncbi:nucleotidyltransferase domain-containing protein [Heyndrickxia sp. MSNUG]|uniref:nucleotidyltransferase domain-containing protein n=1 Tax=Heyndrickxia sp. MSNUG TaxID=3136677 RepID=UPI003C2B5F36
MDTQIIPAPIEAAKRFIKDRFPLCDAALLAGSVVRGEATPTSDLDIVIFDCKVKSPYRESLRTFGWPVEVFVHNLHSYKIFFENDAKRARPSLPRMVSEGIVLKDSEILPAIREEAAVIIENGPELWTEKEIEMKRYIITDTLDDFIGSTKRAEELFIANALADLLHEFVLRTNKHWIGNSKWMFRELTKFDPHFANCFVQAFDNYYKNGEKNQVVELADSILEPFGGQLFEGFSIK